MKKELSDRITLIKDFPENQYFKQVFPKRQIVLHHTASGPGTAGDINWWKQTPERVATCVIVARDGIIHQLFSSKYWAYHLGLSTSNNLEIAHQSIGIETDSWGQLAFKNGKYYSYTGAEVPKQDVIEYPNLYRGHRYYERYTSQQIESIRLLLEYWCEIYQIPANYIVSMWDVSKQALSGTPGIWSHTSFRKDKNDVHPQPDLIEMLKSLL